MSTSKGTAAKLLIRESLWTKIGRVKLLKIPGKVQKRAAFKVCMAKLNTAAADFIDAVRKLPGSVEDALRHYIEHRPYTTVAIALALGWLIGRSHRPF